MADSDIVIDADSPGVGDRLDRFLAAGSLSNLSRSRLQALIKSGHITVNGRAAKPKTPLAAGDRIRFVEPESAEVEIRAEDIPLSILYEDDHVLVLDKAHGMVVHPAAGNPDGTLVNALLHYCGSALASAGGEERAGIVHRLDKDTSGCMVVAKSDAAYESLTAQFSGRKTSKTYLAVVEGRPPMDEGRIENNIGRHPRNRQKMAVVFPPAGKEAVTEYRVAMPREDASLVECRIFTGRTHQIRVHMRELGHPILGDPVYANTGRQKVSVPRLMLHAWRLGFDHPLTAERMAFEAAVPAEFDPWRVSGAAFGD